MHALLARPEAVVNENLPAGKLVLLLVLDLPNIVKVNRRLCKESWQFRILDFELWIGNEWETGIAAGT